MFEVLERSPAVRRLLWGCIATAALGIGAWGLPHIIAALRWW